MAKSKRTGKATDDGVQQTTIQLMISQLLHYGLPKTAKILADEADVDMTNLSASDRIETLFRYEKKFQALEKEAELNAAAGCITPHPPREPARVPAFECRYTIQHTKVPTTATFSPDGRALATGSRDGIIRVLDLERIHARYDADMGGNRHHDHPALKTLQDHDLPVNDLAFHPSSLVLASCSSDGAIKFFDLQNKIGKRSFRYLSDSLPLHSVCFHPSGEYILASSFDSPTIRTFDVRSFQCMRSRDEGHTGGVRQVRMSSDGRQYASCGIEGDIKLWDVVSGRCVHTWQGAHGGLDICSVSFTPDNRYLLTSGLDSVPKMWDLKTFANLRTYTGCDPSNTRVDMMGKDASFVIGRGAATDEIAIWSANHGGPPVTTLAQAHTDTILGVVSTPQQRSFVSLSADLRAKVWTEVLSPSQ